MSYPKLPTDYQKGYYALLIVFLIPIIALGIGLTNDLNFSEKIVLSRYMMFMQAGLLAFITPWIIFQHKPIWFSQMMNPNASQIIRIFMHRMGHLWTFMTVFMSTVVFYNAQPEQILTLFYFWVDVMLFTTGICLFASVRFLKIGTISQLWQEGKRGEKVLAYLKEAGNGPGVPAGSLPTIGTTGLIAFIGMITVIISSWLSSVFQLPVYSISGIILLPIGLISWVYHLKKLDQDYYHSQGFYNELFRNPGGRADAGRDPIPIKSLYWVPGFIKPQLWLTLRQMYRKIPVGRLLLVTFLFYWSLIYGGVLSLQLILIIPLLIILGKNLVILKMDHKPYSSISYQNQLTSQFGWFWVRLYTGIRWMVPIHFALLLTIWSMDEIDATMWQWWILADLSSLLIINVFATVKNYLTTIRQYA